MIILELDDLKNGWGYILDELTGTMDPITKNFVADTIRSARANLGMTFLIVSHDVDFAYNVCDRIAHIIQNKQLEKV